MTTEDEIQEINRKLGVIFNKLADIRVLEEKQRNDRALIKKVEKTITELNKTVGLLNETLIAMTSKKAGASYVWGLVVVSIIAAVAASSVMFIDMNSKIAVFEKQFEIISGKENNSKNKSKK